MTHFLTWSAVRRRSIAERKKNSAIKKIENFFKEIYTILNNYMNNIFLLKVKYKFFKNINKFIEKFNITKECIYNIYQLFNFL
jgi:hypothetical protein